MPLSIVDALDDPDLFGPHFRGGAASWRAWRAFLAALFALPMDADALSLYQRHTGRTAPPAVPFRECALIKGRRAGGSRILATVAVYLAAFRDYAPHLAPGRDCHHRHHRRRPQAGADHPQVCPGPGRQCRHPARHEGRRDRRERRHRRALHHRDPHRQLPGGSWLHAGGGADRRSRLPAHRRTVRKPRSGNPGSGAARSVEHSRQPADDRFQPLCEARRAVSGVSAALRQRRRPRAGLAGPDARHEPDAEP